MNDVEIFQRLGLALAIGLFLGLERGWHQRDEAEGNRIAGVRTFALTGLLGGTVGWLVTVTAPVVLAVSLLGVSGLLAVSYWVRLKSDDDLGLTTEIALLLTFTLGAVSALGEMAPTAAVAVTAALLLSIKQRLHGWVAQSARLELNALLKLAVISVVVLPLLPDEGYGPGATLNPYDLWWAVVVVAGLSFLGYVAMRIGGPNRGIQFTGLVGGLASSTSTTLTLARLVHAQRSLVPLAASGIVIAGSVTFLRILLLVAVFERALLSPLVLPMGVMAGVGTACAVLLQVAATRGEDPPEATDEIANPLNLKMALAFGTGLAIVLLGVYYLKQWLGIGGIYLAAALSGVVDVAALTISVSKLVGDDLTAANGATAIVIAASVNTAVKAGIAMGVGGVALGIRVLVAYTAVILAGGASLWLAGWGG